MCVNDSSAERRLWSQQHHASKESRQGTKLQFSIRHSKFLTEFQQTTADFQWRRLRVLRIFILPLNFSKLGFSVTNFAFLELSHPLSTLCRGPRRYQGGSKK